MNILIAILNSNFFVGLITLIAGSVAFYLYTKQRADSKIDAANIVLLEIQNAERILGQVAESVRGGSLPNKLLLPTESWSKYKYLFVRDFDRDEWDAISEFYSGCELYDEAVRYNSSLFQKNEEQIRVNMLRAPADYIREYIDSDLTVDIEEANRRLHQAFEKGMKFQELYLSRAGSLLYSPQKPLNDAKQSFESLNRTLSQTTIGTKLKRMAKVKS